MSFARVGFWRTLSSSIEHEQVSNVMRLGMLWQVLRAAAFDGKFSVTLLLYNNIIVLHQYSTDLTD